MKVSPRPDMVRMGPPGVRARPAPPVPLDRVDLADAPEPRPSWRSAASVALCAALALVGPLGAAAAPAAPAVSRTAAAPRILDGTRGRIRSLRLQFPQTTRPEEIRARDAMIRDLLTKMDPSVRFEVVAEGHEALSLASSRVHVHVLAPDGPRIKMWARDNAVALTMPDGREVLLVPRSFRGAPVRGPLALEGEVEVRRSSLDFEGGDLVANGRHLLVGETTIRDNMDALGLSADEVVARFEAEMGRDVVVVAPAPDAHIDVGITLVDDFTAFVADPGLGARLLAADGRSSVIPAETLESMRAASEDPSLQEAYDGAAALLEGKGYRVVRLPYLAAGGVFSPEGTWSNVMMERYQDVRKVYMPVYGLPGVDAVARQAWEAEGFEVVEFPSAAEATRLGGAVRCAVGEVDVEQ